MPVDFLELPRLRHGSFSANRNTASFDRIIGMDSTGGVRSVTLTTAETFKGRTFVVKDEGGHAAANNITVDTEGAQTIDGAATDVINTNFGSASYYCDGTNWFKV